MTPEEGGTLHPELRAALLAALDERGARVHDVRSGRVVDETLAAFGEPVEVGEMPETPQVGMPSAPAGR